jgi:hypothetical protein
VTKPRVLFVPAFLGVPSHFIPLLKLYQRLDPGRYDAAFFLPRIPISEVRRTNMESHVPGAEYYYCGEFYGHFDLPVVSGPRDLAVVSELRAYSSFKPDVIIDDCNLTTALTCQVQVKPRVTMLRTGAFGADRAKYPEYAHTLDSMVDAIKVPPGCGFSKPTSLEEYFNADAFVVPGIEMLEHNHRTANGRARAFFSGPLILDEREEAIFQSDALIRFFEINRGRKVAYVTFGAAPGKGSNAKLIDCFCTLIEREFAVLTNIQIAKLGGDSLLGTYRDRFMLASAFPMHYVTSKADIVIHVAGSGMYHYPILHLKPAITVGTQMYDREIVASAMASQGLSYHLPAAAESMQFARHFREAMERFCRGGFPFDSGLRSRLQRTRGEVVRANRDFDLNQAIDIALSARRQ